MAYINNGYQVHMIASVQKKQGNTNIGNASTYSIIAAFSVYPAITSDQYAKMSESNRAARQAAFLNHISNLDYGGQGFVQVNQSRIENLSACPLPIYVSSITLNQSTASLDTGRSLQLTATVLPVNANDRSVTWSSSDVTKATVDQTGKVTGVAAGSVTIRATANDGSGKYAVCEFTITVNQSTMYLLHFDNSLADSSGKDNSVSMWFGQEGYVTSDIGGTPDFKQCFAFNGTRYIQLDREVYNALLLSGNFTLEMFVNLTGWNTTGGVLFGSNRTGNTNQLGCISFANSTLYYTNTDTLAQQIAVPNFIPALNTWYHLAVVCSNKEIKIYRDGQLQGEGLLYASVGSSIALVMGAQTGNSAGSIAAATRFTGQVDELRLSNVPLWSENFTPPTKPY